MTERVRLMIAVAMTALLLAGVSAAGIALHAKSHAPAVSVSAQPTQAQQTSTLNWHEEHD